MLLPGSVGRTAEVPAALPAASGQASVPVYDLNQCLHLAQQQPRLVAARASLSAAEVQWRALENLPAIPLMPGGRELPIRRKQAALGVEIARAELARAEHDVAYFVTRSYFTVVYATMQKRVTAGITRELTSSYEDVKRSVEAGDKKLTTNDVQLVASYQGLAQARDAEAEMGIQRALAALQEAVGADMAPCFTVADSELSYRAVPIDCAEVVALALARRGEIAQADLAVEVHRLEVDAQGKICSATAKTFAAGADIHARVIPPDLHNGEYRPGALAPEMPAFLVGRKCERQQRARDYADRAAAVADKTRNLIVLETKDTYFRWVEASRRIPPTRQASEEATKLAGNSWEEWRARRKMELGEAVKNEVLAAQAKSQHNEALFRYVIGLAALERATGGGFSANLSSSPSNPAP